jgi:energy-converting hydrogenase Eha subunit B
MASSDLEKVDEIRRRLNASYEEALAGLEEAGGELLRALAVVEKKRKAASAGAECGVIVERVLGLAREGKVSGLRVKCGSRVIREIPVASGAVGAVAASLLAALFEQLSVELIRGEPSKAGAEEPGEACEAESSG